MNRRRLLAMLPLAPVALLVPTSPAEGAPLDARPVFKRSEYIMVEVPPAADGLTPYSACGHLHSYWTIDCHTVAVPAESWAAGGVTRPALASAIPYVILETRAVQSCPTEDGDKWNPHTHDGLFRWVN